MDQILQRIAQINSTATGIMEETARSKARLDEAFRQRTTEFDRHLAEETSATITHLRGELEQKLDTELEQLRRYTEEHLLALEETYENRHLELAKRLIDDIIRE